ncbi:MAG: DNA repair protein RadC [Kiloniellales bacterium]|nr:DNA repair protein RadC [Kiloniellales bacterium]MDJ0982357.1 DNA repair protein RadC [Kiloniellales bacterium]
MAGEPSDHHGHRARLRARILDSGAESLADYELLEFLLFGAQPRQDTKPLAKDLIRRFGSLAAVLAAETEALRGVAGVGDAKIAVLQAAREAAVRLAREDLRDRPLLTSWDRLVDYCRMTLGHEAVEQFRVLFLDRKNRLIADERQQKGTVDHTPVYPREVVKRALELGASALILVHNHPSGDPTPSPADIDMTRAVSAAAESLGIAVHDHLILARSGETSLRGLGLI